MADDPLGPGYRKLWVASTISNLGDGVSAVALPLLASSLTRDPVSISLVGLSLGLPWLLFALVSGALVDRLDRRMVMWRVDAFRCALVAVLCAAVFADLEGLPLLYAIGFLLGTAETLFDNASQAIMPSLVARHQLERANGRMFAAQIVTNQFVGPPLGGLLFATATSLPFLLDAASFGLGALLVFAIAGDYRPVRPEGARTRLRGEIAEGLRWLWGHRLLRTLALVLGAMNMIGAAGFAVFVLFAQEILDLGDVGFGILLTSFAVGSLIGSLAAERVTGRIGNGSALILTILLSGVTQLLIGVTSSPLVVAAAAVMGGFVAVVWNVITVSLRQAIIPDAILGRVNSVYRFLGWGSIPVGSAIGGVLAKAFGLRAPFVVGGLALVVVTVLALPYINSRAVAEARQEADAAAG